MIAIIPARYASVRLPGKLLLPIAGRAMILRTADQVKLARKVNRVIIATDDERIFQAVTDDGGDAVMTALDHQSGSDRIAEVAADLPGGSIIVNVQGDEPMISPRTIDAAIDGLLEDDGADVCTTCEPIDDPSDVLSPDVVKVVSDQNGRAMYFSRSPIPFPREAVREFGDLETALRERPDLMREYRKHTGIYVYRREFLLKFAGLPAARIEGIEMLEQLRVLETGAVIKVIEVDEESIGIDTGDDLKRVRHLMEKRLSPV